MAKIYYTVENGIYEGYADGNKEVSVYRIKDQDLELLTVLELSLEDNSQDEIREFLDDEGFEDYELVQL